MTEAEQRDGKLGFRVDNYFVSFPDDGTLVTETPEGDLFINVDVYKMDDSNYIRLKHEEVSEELEIKISAYINEFLMQIIEEYKQKESK